MKNKIPYPPPFRNSMQFIRHSSILVLIMIHWGLLFRINGMFNWGTRSGRPPIRLFIEFTGTCLWMDISRSHHCGVVLNMTTRAKMLKELFGERGWPRTIVMWDEWSIILMFWGSCRQFRLDNVNAAPPNEMEYSLRSTSSSIRVISDNLRQVICKFEGRCRRGLF